MSLRKLSASKQSLSIAMPRRGKTNNARGGAKKSKKAASSSARAVKEVYSDDEGSDIERKEMAR